MEIGVKTDLKLLLECLKCQLDNSKAQKEALVTIASICTDSDKGKEALLDFGGLKFIRDLATSTKHQDVKQAAMYALACTVDANIFCQKQLSSMALFVFLHDELVNRTSVLELKKMAIYLTSCLVSNNNDCQMLVRKSGCLQVLLESFKQSSETLEQKGMFDGDHIDKTDEEFTVWSSTLLTICVSVNNPQNGENQRLCMSVIPVALKILTKSDSASVIRPISSLIGLTVSNNAPNQERLRLVGGLKCIVLRLEKLITSVSQQCTADDVDSIALAIHLSGTLNSCVADNSSNKECVAELVAVKSLLTLLCCDFLDVKHRLQLIVTLVHCTDSCVESQLQLLDNGGLAVIVKYMSEIQDDEFIKAATYLLRICVQEDGMTSDTINPSAKIGEEKQNQISANNGQLSQFGDCLTKLTLILEKMNAVSGDSHSDSDADADNGKRTKDENVTVTVEKRSEEKVINADKMHKENREVTNIHPTNDPESRVSSTGDYIQVNKQRDGQAIAMEIKAKPSENPSSRYTVSLDTDTALKTCCHRDQEPRDQKRQGSEESSSVSLDVHKISCPVANVMIHREQYRSTQAPEHSGKARNCSLRNQSHNEKLFCCPDKYQQVECSQSTPVITKSSELKGKQNSQSNNFVTPAGKTELGHHKDRESEKSCALHCEEDSCNVEEVSMDYTDIPVQGTSDMVCVKERQSLKQSNTVSSGKHNCKIFKKPAIPLLSCDDDDETWSDYGRPAQNRTPKRSRVPVSVRKSHQNVKVIPPKPVCPSENLEYSSNPATKSSTSDESCTPEINRHSASAQKKKSMIFQHGRMVTPRKATEGKTFLARRCHAAVTRKNSAAVSTSRVDALSSMKKHNVLSRKRRRHPVNGATASCQSDMPSFTLPQGYKHRKIFVARWMSDSKAQSHFLSTPPKRNLKRQCRDEIWTNQDHFMHNCPGCTLNVETILDSRNYNYWIDRSLKTCSKHRRIRALEKEFIREQNCVPETPVKPIRHVGSIAALNRMKLNFADIVVTPRRRRLNFPSSPSIYDYLGSES